MQLDLPIALQDWHPVTQATVLGLLTFIQEDVPTLAAALLAAAGTLPWPYAFAGVFLGIWLGDALLYFLARTLGRPLASHPWMRRRLNPETLARSERWFAKRGGWLLLACRFIPGTRLPTYLAAGFLRLSPRQFLTLTGIAVGIWTSGIFLLATWAGPKLMVWMRRWENGGWWLLLAACALVLLVRRLSRWIRSPRLQALRTGALRWRHWEFWPAWLFYLPVALQYLRLALRHRGLTVPTAANPGMFSGGFVGESKFATLDELQRTHPGLTATATLIPTGPLHDRLATLERFIDLDNLLDPLILKPDVGQRGAGVRLVRSRPDASNYLQQVRAPVVAQRYAPGPHEAGIFYYRHPGETRGRILAITEKVFPVVIGDGRTTVENLIRHDPRARFLARRYLQRHASRAREILPPGTALRLVEAGNHAQGCIFRDGARLLSPALEARIDEISRSLTGFFVGRYDIRYASEVELREGRAFQIVELNGAASEATSIYDARHSVLAAYRMLFRQWSLVFAIGAENRRRGFAPTPLRTLWLHWRQAREWTATYPLAD